MVALLPVSALPSVTNLILIVSSLTLFLIYYLRKKYSYWEKRGVPYVKPALFYGNTKDIILRRSPIALVFQQIYKELNGHKFGGFYQFTKPFLLLRDPDMIKMFVIKHFSHFHDRYSFLDEKLDPITAHLINLSGQRWKNVRSKLTPTFSSAKLRLMQNLMQGCVQELDTYLTKFTSGDSQTSSVLNLKELMARYATDVIGSCAFGVYSNAIRDEDSEVRRIGRLAFRPNFRFRLRNFLRLISPRLVSWFKIKWFSREINEFFETMLREAVMRKESTAQKRNNFLELLVDIQAQEKKQLQKQNLRQHNEENIGKHSTQTSSDLLFTDSIVASNMFIFFVAGFETISTTLSHCLYELTVNPDICDKIKDEVESVKQAHGGNLDYDSMKELVYMESVISETLRKYPVISTFTRQCTKTFQIPNTSVVIDKGTDVIIPVYGLHHDPQYFPEPEKFLPERFSEGNKHSIIPGTYLPFGDGPRSCIGMRFAMFEMKSVLSYLASNFTFHPCDKTVIPVKFNHQAPFLSPLGGIWVRLQRRPH